MNFDDLDLQMRQYERSLDQIILPKTYIVARLDGRNFTRLTKDICQFEAPFDIRFRDMMVDTVKSLMDCGFRVVYGFTESDEISLLFHLDENAFGRKVRKYNSTLAGTASAAFSLQLGRPAVFDCRIVPLPDVERIKDYFLWRQEDAHRNALNAHCYWALRREGFDVAGATAQVEGRSIAEKDELLLEHGICFGDLPSWQKSGVGLWWRDIEKLGFNPKTQQTVTTTRRELYVEYELPLRAQYGDLIANMIG